MFKCIKKIFKKENPKKEKISMKKRFEIEVFDEDMQDSGYMALKPRGTQIVEGNNINELRGIFKMCGQQIKLVRELGDVPEKNQKTIKIQEQPSLSASNNLKINEQKPQTIEAEVAQIINTDVQPTTTVNRQSIGPKTGFINNVQKPKYYKIGDIEIKNENNKIYQKQWMRLTDEEASNIRVINTKTNKIFSLSDKHLEIKKWVLIEDKNNGDETSEILYKGLQQ